MSKDMNHKKTRYILLRGDSITKKGDRVVYSDESIGGPLLKNEIGVLVSKTGYYGVGRPIKLEQP